MTIEEFEFLLFDRIEKIKQINSEYDLENNAYISFSGGKDSTVLHYLIDLALPNNKIPRVFINTGIEYNSIVKFVKELANKDDRINIIKPTKSIKKILTTYGYPFKSKDFAQKVSIFNRKGYLKGIKRFLSFDGILACPSKLKYLFEKQNNTSFEISDKCCLHLKENVLKKFSLDNNKKIAIIGLTGDEQGRRRQYSNNCFVNYKNEKLFYPMRTIKSDFIKFFIQRYKIKLCELYYEPYNFTRIGCKGCPFNYKLQEDLETLKKYFYNEYKQCETIWKPVYDEYRRIGYRLRKDTGQLTIFDFIESE